MKFSKSAIKYPWDILRKALQIYVIFKQWVLFGTCDGTFWDIKNHKLTKSYWSTFSFAGTTFFYRSWNSMNIRYGTGIYCIFSQYIRFCWRNSININLWHPNFYQTFQSNWDLPIMKETLVESFAIFEIGNIIGQWNTTRSLGNTFEYVLNFVIHIRVLFVDISRRRTWYLRFVVQ